MVKFISTAEISHGISQDNLILIDRMFEESPTAGLLILDYEDRDSPLNTTLLGTNTHIINKPLYRSFCEVLPDDKVEVDGVNLSVSDKTIPDPDMLLKRMGRIFISDSELIGDTVGVVIDINKSIEDDTAAPPRTTAQVYAAMCSALGLFEWANVAIDQGFPKIIRISVKHTHAAGKCQHIITGVDLHYPKNQDIGAVREGVMAELAAVFGGLS